MDLDLPACVALRCGIQIDPIMVRLSRRRGGLLMPGPPKRKGSTGPGSWRGGRPSAASPVSSEPQAAIKANRHRRQL